MRLVVAAGMLLAAVAVRAQTPEQSLDKAAAVYANMKTAHVTFTQTVDNPLTNKAVTSKGDMIEKLPGHYLVTFSDPAGDRIVSDGRVVWIYLPSTNPGQVIRMPVGSGAASVPDFTSWLLDSPKDRFKLGDGGTATLGGKSTHIVTLVPKGAGTPFKSAKLWIGASDGIVRQFETVDANGSTRKVRIDSIEMGVPAGAGLFTFKVPDGVKVYEPGGTGT